MFEVNRKQVTVIIIAENILLFGTDNLYRDELLGQFSFLPCTLHCYVNALRYFNVPYSHCKKVFIYYYYFSRVSGTLLTDGFTYDSII